LGDALVAPIVPFVPEGNIDPPTGHMNYPGTISLSEETYQRLLTDICLSLRKHGFRHIILLGDSDGNQLGMKAVASRLDANRLNGAARVLFIPEYYDNLLVDRWLDSHGVRQHDEGLHDDFATTAQLMVVDPTTVRMKQRMAVGKFRINGIDLSAVETVEWGKQIIALRADTTVRAIRKAIQEQGTP
jgi:creatinine amidohydrolase